MLERAALLSMSLVLACSSGEKSPAPQTAAKPVVAAEEIRPTVEPIREEVAVVAEVEPIVDDSDSEPEVEMRPQVIERTVPKRESAPAPARAPAEAPAPADERDIAKKERDEPVEQDQERDLMLSDGLLDMDTESESEPAEAAAAAAPVRKSVASLGGTEAMIETSLSPAAVRRTIQKRYLGDIRGCHESYLTEKPDAAGDVALQINVGPEGAVVLARVMGFAPRIDACLKDKARGWRFESPRDASGAVTTAPFKVHLWLKAG